MITMEKTTPKKGKVHGLLSEVKGITLLEYSKLRALFAVEIAKLTLRRSELNLIENIRISALLQDIGKCCHNHQKAIKNQSMVKKAKFLNNEIGWAFLTKYIHEKGYEFVLDSIYWNNGITTNRNKTMGGYNNNNVLDTVDEIDKGMMLDFLKEAIKTEYPYHYDGKFKTDAPDYYKKGGTLEIVNNAEKTFIRTCIISANELVYSLNVNRAKEILEKNDATEIKRLVENLSKRNFYKEELNFDNYDKSRLNIQIGIINDCDKITIVNAPSGFGKTLIGVLWNLMLSNKKLIWVCPRNAVAQAVYYNIIKELTSLGIEKKISVELYLTGETKKSNSSTNGFNSDIIITNIDNFLNPSINTNNADRLFFITNCDVVFDEYHELVKEEALFAGFINIMNTRSRFTNSRTILLSATPMQINNLWDNGVGFRTKVLPNGISHYPAAHKKKYEINVFNIDSIEKFKTRKNISSIVVFNSISNSQIIHNQVGSEKLIHSSFCADDKENIFNYIYDRFGKKSSRSLTKENLTGTHVIQASLDVSFANLYESVLSPLCTLQRVGRCDRWGDYEGTPKLNIYKIDDTSENKMKEILYTKDLSNKWFSFLSKYHGKELTLDKLYEIYNEFNKINSSDINRYIENCHDKSLQHLIKIYPKHFIKGRKSDIKIANTNKLRSIGNEIFFICKVHDSDNYSDIITDSNRSYFKDYDEDKNTLGRMIKAMKSIRSKKDERYDFSELIKQWDINSIRDAAVCSNTPYIRFDVVYHPEYGVIKKSLLSKINQ